MRLHSYSHQKQADYHILRASVTWEDVDRPTQEIFFRYRAPDPYFLPDNYHPFLLAAIVPALRRGERRIKVEGAVCPWLKGHLNTFMAHLTNWYWYKYGRHRHDRRVPTVEAEPRSFQRPPTPRTGSFFSGGVDSLSTIRRNRLTVPLDHPGSITDAIVVHGFDLGFQPARGTDDGYFQFVIDSMKEVVADAGLNLIPVFTNLRTLDPHDDCWLDEYMGSAMAAVAHGLAGRLSDVLVASTYDIATLHPFASHPFLDPHLSSYGLRLHHDGEQCNRVEKVRMIAEWPAALNSLRVCLFGDEGMLNCGRCAKCVRTKLELLCAGKLRDARTLPGDVPCPDMVRRTLTLEPETIAFMDGLIAALRKAGRTDLARSVSRRKRAYFLGKAGDWAFLVKALDERFLDGRLKRAVRLYRSQYRAHG
ncbi:MAG TPA: hypothetical protein VFF86_02255 [Candidatus Methylomirabilis sp.]|nr:hypothetical protein [Candidatus Methylomirabilis sp.]